MILSRLVVSILTVIVKVTATRRSEEKENTRKSSYCRMITDATTLHSSFAKSGIGTKRERVAFLVFTTKRMQNHRVLQNGERGRR